MMYVAWSSLNLSSPVAGMGYQEKELFGDEGMMFRDRGCYEEMETSRATLRPSRRL